MTTVRLRAFVPVVMTLALAACTSTQTVSTTTTTTEPLSAFVDVSAAPVGWMPVVYGDAQVSVPGTWTVIYDAPPYPSGQTPGEVFVNPRPGLFHCPPVSSPYGSQTVVELLALPSGANIPATLGTRRVINGIPFYQDQGTDYLLQLGVKLTVEGPLAERVLQTVTYSPHFVALASEPAPVVPASWHSVIFGGLRFSVPAGWRTYRTPMWSGLELCGIRQVVPVDDSITLSTDVWHGMGVCPTDEGAPRGAQQPSNGVLLDSGLSPLLVAEPFAERCLSFHDLKMSPATSPAYSILVLRVRVPGRSMPVFVSIGLAGNGMVARAILDSLRSE